MRLRNKFRAPFWAALPPGSSLVATMIHQTAVIHPKAQLDSSVKVGPYAVIDEAVTVGQGTVIEPHVYLTGHTTIGMHDRFHARCLIGHAPQHLHHKNQTTRLPHS